MSKLILKYGTSSFTESLKGGPGSTRWGDHVAQDDQPKESTGKLTVDSSFKALRDL